MKNRRASSFALLFAFVCFFCTSSFGQEKISIRRVPAPNQTIKMKMVQDVQMDMNMSGGTALPGLGGPMKMVMKTTATRKIGTANGAGVTTTEMTIDEATTEATMNGQPMAVAPANALVGKTVTVSIDKEGKVVDAKTPPDLKGATDTYAQFLKSVSGNVPDMLLAVGEEVTAPLDNLVSLPIVGGSNMKISGQIKYKLVSIDRDADGSRIAHFDITTDGTMVSDSQAPPPIPGLQMNMNMKMSGTGSAFHNLDKGFLKSSETRSTLSGTIGMGGGGLPMSQTTMTGVMVQTVAQTN